jgi:hypothetical protein
MTITYKGEIPAGRQARNALGIRTYQRQFRLLTDSRSDGPYAIGSNASLPSIGSAHPEDASAWCRELTVENDEPYTGWIVTANYSSERELSETPTSDPAYITWDSEQFQRPVLYDNTGDAVCNSAGGLFDPPAMMDDSRRVVTVQKNLSAVPVWILDYQDAVNSDQFTVDGVTIAIGKAKMQRVSVGPEDIRNGITFRQVTFTIHLQRDGWNLEVLDAGFIRKKPSDLTARESLYLDDGTEPAGPQMLDGSGGILSDPTPANAVFLSFDVYKTRTFSSLPLS